MKFIRRNANIKSIEYTGPARIVDWECPVCKSRVTQFDDKCSICNQKLKFDERIPELCCDIKKAFEANMKYK